MTMLLVAALALLLAAGAAPWMSAGAPPQSRDADGESITEFEAPGWPFLWISFRRTWHVEYYPGQAHGGQLYVSSGNDASGNNDRASVQVIFYGSSVKLVTARYWQCGWCEVFLDGRSRGTFNLASDATQFDQVLFEDGGLRRGIHNIRVVNLGIPGSDDPIAQEYDLHYVNVDYMVVE
jgi:hypothetical protein